jgi:TatD DNase family protein
MFIDTHTHLLSEEFDIDREKVIKRAKDVGVFKFIEVGYDESYSEKVAEFVLKNDDFFGSIGIHPHNAMEMTKNTIEKFYSLGQLEKIIAIGEIGLDYYRDLSPRDIQETVFREQIKLALSLSKPIIIHCRDAKDDLKKILKEYNSLSGIIHAFSGTLQDAEFYVKKGFVLGISGVLTYKNNLPLKDLVKNFDLDNIVLETDCPYLPPVPHRGKRNEPSFLNFVREEISNLKCIDVKKIDEITTNNVKRIFGILK